jgi:hypothetical protein
MKRSVLKSDPEQVRAWTERSRERARQQAREDAGNGQVRTRRKRKVKIPAEVRERVAARTDGYCICGCGRWAFEIHHVLPEGKFPELAKAESNYVAVNPVCHARHENAFRRLRRDCLPQYVLDLAATDSRYQLYLERTYPKEGNE